LLRHADVVVTWSGLIWAYKSASGVWRLAVSTVLHLLSAFLNACGLWLDGDVDLTYGGRPFRHPLLSQAQGASITDLAALLCAPSCNTSSASHT
jgi:hypothetical protein